MKYINFKSFTNKQINKIELKLKKRKLTSYPVAIHLEPTIKCNSNCMMCNRQLIRKEEVLKGDYLSWDTFNKVKPFFSTAEEVLFGGFGEPLLHKDIIPMIMEIKKHNPYLYFYTNGISLTPEISKELILAGIDEICISFGGATEETYQKIRGVPMFPIVKNIEKLSELKKTLGKNKPKISFAIVVMKSIFEELVDIVDLAKDIGVTKMEMANIVIQDENLQDESPWRHKIEYEQIMKEFIQKARSYNMGLLLFELNEYTDICQHIFSSMTITWDGFILSCPQERFITGNLAEESIGDIWNNKNYLMLREKYYQEGLKKLCPNCFAWKNDEQAYLHPNKNSRIFAEEI
ncbi:MAG: radical SAM protein [bacterium]|nr:radical SAM protein [bacterium]